MKKSLTLLLASLTIATFAQPRGPKGHRGPQFTDEQKSCLEELIGRPGEGERPSREEMEAAFEKCGIERPEPPSRESHNTQDFE